MYKSVTKRLFSLTRHCAHHCVPRTGVDERVVGIRVVGGTRKGVLCAAGKKKPLYQPVGLRSRYTVLTPFLLCRCSIATPPQPPTTTRTPLRGHPSPCVPRLDIVTCTLSTTRMLGTCPGRSGIGLGACECVHSAQTGVFKRFRTLTI